MQHVNGIEQAKILPAAIAEVKPIRQLIKAADVARKLGVSISWVVQHASGKRKPYLPAVKMRSVQFLQTTRRRALDE